MGHLTLLINDIAYNDKNFNLYDKIHVVHSYAVLFI